jgi:hypothetical protein
MSLEKLRRINLKDEEYAKAIQIGSISDKSLDGEKAKAYHGVITALQHFEGTQDIDPEKFRKLEPLLKIDEAIVNNIKIVYMLGENEGMGKNEISDMINTAIKTISSRIINGQP